MSLDLPVNSAVNNVNNVNITNRYSNATEGEPPENRGQKLSQPIENEGLGNQNVTQTTQTTQTTQGQLKDNSDNSDNKDNEDNEDNEDTFRGKKKEFYSPLNRIAPCNQINGLLEQTNPSKDKNFNKTIFGLIRSIKAIEKATGNKYNLDLICDQWEKIYPFDRMFKEDQEFCIADELQRIYLLASSSEPINKLAHQKALIQFKEEDFNPYLTACFKGKRRRSHIPLALMCKNLADLHEGEFFLSVRHAGTVIGAKGEFQAPAGSRALKSLVSYGIIEPVSLGSRETKSATSYRYILKEEGDQHAG